MKAWFLVLALVVAACSGRADDVSVEPSPDHSQTRVAVDRFVKSGRTPPAFAELTSSIEEMRGADPVLALEAELRLLALAAPIMADARSRTLARQVDELALTVWPTLLSGPLTGAARPTVVPSVGETPNGYVARLCAGDLASECGSVSADEQAIIVRAIALRNANERMRTALARCLHCESDGPEWQRLGWTIDSLANEAAHYRSRTARAERPVIGRL